MNGRWHQAGSAAGVLLLALAMTAMATDLPLPRLRRAVNLLQDGGFENSGPLTLTRHTSPWVGEETNVALVVNDGQAHSGSQEAVFRPGSVANQGQLMQMFSCQANTDYVASAWIGGTPGFSTVGQPANNDTSGHPTQRGFGVHIPTPGADPDGDGDTQGFDASIIIKYVTITNNSSGSYQFYSFTFNSGSHTQLFVDFDANIPANGILRVDDVSVTPVGGGGGGGPVAPAVTSQPSNRSVTAGQTATFSVGASGTAPLSYQWEKNGAAISGATGSSYTTPPTTLADSGELFRVVVTNAAGSVTSASAMLTVGAASGGGSLPAPWKDGDVGSVGVPGSASATGGVFTVKASGSDIGGTIDSFNFVYQQLSGDCTLEAHVTSLGNTSSKAQAGVMIRESLDPSSPWADMLITPAGAQFQGRSQLGTGEFSTGGPSVVAPYWLKVTRSGNTFTGSTSPDGSSWSVAGTASISMSANVFVGLAVTSHNNGVLDVATFDSVSVSGGGGGVSTALPSPWLHQDVGAVGVAGSATFSNGTFTVKGSGADIGGTVDAFQYVYQPLTGDGSLTAHVAALGNTNAKAQAGVMIRETLDAGSRFADMLITPQNGASFQGRVQVGSTNFNDGGVAVTEPYWIRITRAGNTFTGSISADGLTWSVKGSAQIPMASTVMIGLAVTSCNNSVLDTATMDSVSR
ncbi:MAG TPA: hypothetical protein VKW04_18620 [Planctomycetota bacterium]|nr:hypothetical protein [Planctomycetota bacterium]